MHTFSHTASTSGASCHNLCQYYLRPSTFERLFPPWIGIKSIHYIKSTTNVTDTSVSTTFTLPFRLSHPFWQPWKRLSTYDAQSQRFFEELQHPLFVHLEHVRTINLLSHTTQNHIDVTNSITYCLSQYRYLEQSFLFQKIYQKIDRELEKIFSYQNRICCHDVQFLPTLAAPYTIVLAGASGFLGKALSIYLQSLGHQV